jgi:hypothetical protein
LTVHDVGSAAQDSQAATLDLKLTGVNIAVPRACQQVPASVSLTSPQFTLETSLELSDGDVTRTLLVPTQWTCVRNDSGNVVDLRTVKPLAPELRPGLAVSISGPRRLDAGSLVTYTVRVRNDRRRPRDRVISSLWNVRTQTEVNPTGTPANAEFRQRGPVVAHLGELPRHRSKVLHVPIRIPAAAYALRRVCVGVLATADSAQPASAEACAAIRTRRAPRGPKAPHRPPLRRLATELHG